MLVALYNPWEGDQYDVIMGVLLALLGPGLDLAGLLYG